MSLPEQAEQDDQEPLRNRMMELKTFPVKMSISSSIARLQSISG